MAEATKELGTDNSLVIYQTLQSVKTTVESIQSSLETLGKIPQLVASQEAIENTLYDLLANRQEDTVNISQMADKIIENVERTHSCERGIADLSKKTDDILLQGKGTQATLDTFVGWFTPILDDFRNTSILPTLQKTLGRVEELYESHNDIKTLASNFMDKVDPLLKNLEKSPILRMLGVNGND